MGDSDQQRRVVVAIDGSRPSLAALHWAARRAARGGLPLVLVHVEIRPDADYPETREVAAQTLAGLIKERIGVSAKVNVRNPEALERSLGKAKRVIDKRSAR